MPLSFVRNDLTKMNVDAIVNPSNKGLRQGRGTSRAVFLGAGEEALTRACRSLGYCEEGKAVITEGFALPARYIIHAVCPRWWGGMGGEREKLASAYRSALSIAKAHQLESIAFPLLSAGFYGFPKKEAVKIAVAAIGSFLMETDMDVYLVFYDRDSIAIGRKLSASVREYIDDHYVEEREETGSPVDLTEDREGYGSAAVQLAHLEHLDDLDFDETVLSEQLCDGWSEDRPPMRGKRLAGAPSGSSVPPILPAPTAPPMPSAPIPPSAAKTPAPMPPAFFKASPPVPPRASALDDTQTLSCAQTRTQANARPRSQSPARFQSQPQSQSPVQSRPQGQPYAPSQFQGQSQVRPCTVRDRRLEDLLKNVNETFSQMLLRLIDERGLKDSVVYRKANIDRRLFSKIRNDPDHMPTKKTVLAFAVALELSLDETRDLLMKAGYAFSNSSRSDIILSYFIENRRYDIFEINEVLFSYQLPLLGGG